MVFRFFNFRRKAKQLIWLLSTLCFVQQSVAAEIVMEPYQYPPEALAESPVHFTEREMFVICDCPEAPDLVRRLVASPLSIKTSKLQKGLSKTSALKRTRERSKPIKYTLPFAFDADRLSPEAEIKLKKIIKKIKAMPGDLRIKILGHSSDIGSGAYNTLLSRRRAESVKQYFETHQIKTETVAGKGSCCPVSKKQRLNRRVEIIIEEGESS